LEGNVGTIIAIANNKGGVGKTTVAVNLADALGRAGKRVLMVDADSQCNSSSILVPPETRRNTLYELLDPSNGGPAPSKCIYATGRTNVSCLPNIGETAALEPDIIFGSPSTFFLLRNRLRQYAIDNFDYTLIDCPPNIGTFVLCSLYAADFVIVPITAASTYSVDGLLKAMDLVESIRKESNPNLIFLKLLINRLDKRTLISRSITEHIAQNFAPDKIFQTSIPINTAFEKAEALKKTIFEFDQTAMGARAFRALAKELIDGVDHG
jgi:chromosome partitioning protein